MSAARSASGRPWLRRARVLLRAAAVLALLLIALVLAAQGASVTAPDEGAAAQAPGTLPTDEGGARDEVVEPGDPRSEGSGPGLVGAPLLVLLGVVLLGLLSAAVTALVVRLGRGPSPPPGQGPPPDQGPPPG